MLELKWLWKYMGPKRRYLIIGLCLSAVTSAMLIINPMLSQKLIDEVITPQNTAKLLPLLGLMLAAEVIRLSLRYLMIVLLEKNSQQMLDDVRTRLYDVIQNEDYRFFGRMRTGDLMTRMTNDLDMIRHSTAWISYSVVDSVVIFAVTIIYFFTVNVPLTLCLAAITPFILLITMAFSKIVHPMYVNLRAKLSSLNTVAQENIEGNRVVKAFAREAFEKQKFEERNEEFRKENLKVSYVGVKIQPFIDLLSQSLSVTTLLVGGYFMIQGTLSAGEMLAFSSLTWALANPLRNLGMLINDIQRFFASCDMVMEVFYAVPSIVDHSDAEAPKQRAKGDVEFRGVTFRVDGKDAVTDVSFHIKPGETLGIMGTTGSGKTSLVNLMTRAYEPTQGTVLLDGKDVQKYPLSFLRKNMAVAMQDVFLFSDTVEGNIAYGQADLSEEGVVACARAADADGFIRRLSEGYDTLIGERGVGLSGGQKQRISLARALAMRPSVLVLDDTTSAVDMETEQYIQGQLHSLDFLCTKVVIAQRVSSVQDADEILILDNGRIIEHGTHEELLKNRGFYYKIWALQNSVKEGEPIGA
ncbi:MULTISPECIES: ABC transporter ATP-binding protein [Caproicibacterium]|uniref:ABC transporter ATP-binding protein n=1 Tax=Caproicibacterium argilliputei TaxID=3030016 RepID=A0AA97D9A6_9FIRM|nr:ABC transporter ATP-binding protein [Caproicibacterium argilliputei]WOC31388.1 ABC transporter ATP-binding protein [Caproicibacterium argilliputei]